MATTLQTLRFYYSNVMRVDASAQLPTADATLLTTLASQVDAGNTTLAAAQQTVAKLAINTTSVANLSYNFFTGLTPFAGGLDYLVSPTGGNAANLNSNYYQSFNLENRYINFAVNLGKLGEGATKFAADYGSLTLEQAVIKAYKEIFGVDKAGIESILTADVGGQTRAQYFAYYGRDGLTGIGTKAAMVGWLLAEAAKADIGTYAQAESAFLADLGLDGVANFHTNIVSAYGTRPAGTAGAAISFTANQSVSTTADDAALKSTANNDTISGTAGLNANQSILAGDGNDVITISGTTYGAVNGGEGDNTLTIGALGATTGTLGVPAQYGTVIVGSGVNTVYMNGGSVDGTTVTANGPYNTLHFGGAAGTTYAGKVSGFSNIYIDSPVAITGQITGASVIYDTVASTFGASQKVYLTAANHELVVLKDTSYGVVISDPSAAGQTNVDIHLQNFKGAPTTGINRAIGGIYDADGGAIKVITQAPTGNPGLSNSGVTLHVDSDSTAGFIFGYSVSSISANFQGAMPNLKIVGPGSLKAQISNNFYNVDATQAGDLDLSYFVPTSAQTASGTFALGNGTNKLALGFAGTVAGSTNGSMLEKFVLGSGADTVTIGGSYPQATFAQTSLNNLSIAAQTVNAAPEILSFGKGVDHLVLDTVIHSMASDVQQYATGAASLTAALIAVSAHVAANQGAVFTYGGDTYVYAQDALVGVNMADATNLGDGLVKLTGVTGLTVGTGAGSFDIHYG